MRQSTRVDADFASYRRIVIKKTKQIQPSAYSSNSQGNLCEESALLNHILFNLHVA